MNSTDHFLIVSGQLQKQLFWLMFDNMIIMCGHKIIIRGHDILMCSNRIILRGHKIIIRGHDIMGGHEIIMCGHDCVAIR